MEKESTPIRITANRKFWIPVIVSVPLTIVFAIVAAITADFGFATYEAAMVLFPYEMLSILWFGVIHPVIAIGSLFQWPLYGVIVGRAWVRGRFVAVVGVLLLVHLVATVLAIKFIKYPAEHRRIVIMSQQTAARDVPKRATSCRDRLSDQEGEGPSSNPIELRAQHS